MERLPGFNFANIYEKRQLLFAVNCIAGLSIFFFGYDQGFMAGVNNAKDFIDRMGFGYVDPDTKEPIITDSLLQGGIVSVYYLGTLAGCLLGGWIGDKIGRIRTIAFGSAWAIVGAALQCAAMNPEWMICCKFDTGSIASWIGMLTWVTNASPGCERYRNRCSQCYCPCLGD